MPPPNTPEEGLPVPEPASAATRTGSDLPAHRRVGWGRLGSREMWRSPVPEESSSPTDSPQSTSSSSSPAPRNVSLSAAPPSSVPPSTSSSSSSQSPSPPSLSSSSPSTSSPSSSTTAIDYQSLDYIGEVNESLICPICKTPFYRAVTVQNCGHTFCQECLRRSYEIQPRCPIDREPFRHPDDVFTARVIADLVDRLTVQCPNPGCGHVGPREDLAAHCERRCAHALVQCPDPSCDRLVMRRDADPARGCLHRDTSCPYCHEQLLAADLERHYDTACHDHTAACPLCGDLVVRHCMARHVAAECPESEARCRWSGFGCPFAGRRRAVELHEAGRNCVYEAIGKLQQTTLEDRMMINELRDELTALRKQLPPEYASPLPLSSSSSSSPPMQNRRPYHHQYQSQFSHPSNHYRHRHHHPRRRPDAVDAFTLLDPNANHDDDDDGSGHSNNNDDNNNDIHVRGSDDSSGSSSSAADVSTMPAVGTWESPDEYMLAQFERMETSYEELRKALTELDGRHSMMVLNETMPLKEQLSELRSSMGVIGMHCTWMMNMFRQGRGLQRSGAGASGSNGSSGGGGGSGGGGSGGGGGGGSGSAGLMVPAVTPAWSQFVGGGGGSTASGDSDAGGYRSSQSRRNSDGRGEHPPRL